MIHTSAKAYKGIGMEGLIAKWYAANTSKAMNEFRDLARQVAEELPPGACVLEVAPGPGYFAIELARLGPSRITGLDISKTFVDIARRNAAEAKVAIDFREGNASAMPFGNDSFDFLLCRAAFKNFAEPVAALQEMNRVLKPGGKALIIDLRRDASRESINQGVEEMGVNRVNEFFIKLTFRHMLLKRAYTRSEFERFLAQTPFRRVNLKESLMSLEIRLEK
jgi:ubiquinone/menaquinone biosynthesis C-methylase UbiE